MRPREITQLRHRLGDDDVPLSQSGLAKLLGVDQATVCKWEKGSQAPRGPAVILMSDLTKLRQLARKQARERQQQRRLAKAS